MLQEYDHDANALSVTADRRNEPRSEAAYEITPLVRFPLGTFRGQVINISPSGDACLLFDSSPGANVGTRVSICYGTTRESGVVRHVSTVAGKYRVGIRLVDRSPLL
jgi:hypothetical protein